MSLLLEIILIVVAVFVVANILSKRRNAGFDRDEMVNVTPRDRPDSEETRRLREEVVQLKKRLQVLERIAVDKENSLGREIDQLRDG